MAVRDRPSIGCGVTRLQSRAGGRQDGTMIAMSPQRFDELVEAAFDRIPDELTSMLDNVVLFVEDDAPADDPDLLGLYDGTPLTERDSQYSGVLPDRIMVFRTPTLRLCGTGGAAGAPRTGRASQSSGVLPDRIMVFRNPTLRMCETEDEVVAEVEITVAHEIAHHFGIEDDRLHGLGDARGGCERE